MAKPKVTLLHYTCSPIAGGVEMVMEAHARLMADHGYDVQVIAARGAQFDERIPFVRIEQIDSTYPTNIRVQGQLTKGTLSPLYHEYRQELKRLLGEALADRQVVVAHNVLAKDLNFALVHAFSELIAENDGSCRFVSWVHDPSAVAFDAPTWMATTDEMPWRLINRPLAGVEHVTLSRERQREMCDLYGVTRDKITVIPDGVDPVQLLGLQPLTVRIWEEFDLIEQDLVLFTPSRIVHKKNIELSIQVTRELNQLGRKTKLIITGPPSVHLPNIGKSSYYQRMKKLARKLNVDENIIFLYEYEDEDGNPVSISPSVVRDMYLLTDLLFLGSLEEGFGMPLLEAGLLKTRVVCSNIEPFKEIAEKDVLYLELGESPRESAIKIVASMENSQRRTLFKKVFWHYRWETIFKKRIEPYLLHGPLPTNSE